MMFLLAGPQQAHSAAIIRVSGETELLSAIAASRGGDIIELAPGNYGALRLKAKQAGWASGPLPLTIRSAGPGHRAVFNAISLSGVRNLALDGVAIQYAFAPGEPPHRPTITIRDSDGIAIRNALIVGDNARASGTPADGYATGIGLVVSESRNIEIRDSEIRTWHRGATFGNVDGLVIAGNNLHDMRSDGMDFASVRDVLIEGNHIHDFRRAPKSGDHADMIQFWTNGTKSPTRSVRITGNFLDIGNGNGTQSIFMRNEEVDKGRAGDEMFYGDIAIEGNVIRNAHAHGITVGETDGLSIVSNTLVQSVSVKDGGKVSRPSINVKSKARNVDISRNLAPAIGGLSQGTPDTWTVGGNSLVQRDVPGRADHYRNVFVNAEAPGALTLEDLTVMPDSEAGRARTGSPLTRFDTTPSTPRGFILCRAKSPNALVQDCDATHVYGPDGPWNMGDVEVSWSFGDGSSASGQNARHRFAAPGIYTVTATAVSGGRTATLRRTIQLGGN